MGFFSSIGLGIIGPLLPAYVVSMGATLSFAGMIVGLLSIVALVARPLASVLGDGLNKKWLYVATSMLSGVSLLLYVLAPTAPWLLPVRVLHGIVFSVNGTIMFALGADFIPEGRLGEGVGYLGIGQIVGMALGPNLGIYLAEQYSYQFSFIVSGLIFIASGLALSVMLRYSYTPKPRIEGKRTFKLNDLIAIDLLPNAFFGALLAVASGVMMSYIVMHGEMQGIANVGLFFIANSAVLMVTRPYFGKLTDRKGVAFMVIPAFLLTAIGMVIVGVSRVLWPILIAAVIMALAGGGMPAIQADCLKRVDATRTAVATSTYFVGIDIGICIGQMLGGVIADSYGFPVTFVGAGGFMVFSCALYLLYLNREKRKKALVQG